MKTAIPRYSRPGWTQAGGLRAWIIACTLLSSLASTSTLLAQTLTLPFVQTLSGGPYTGNPLYYGYFNGETATEAQFRTPIGLALGRSPEGLTVLYVADRDNNAIRKIEPLLPPRVRGSQTVTFLPNDVVPTNWISKPVGVAVDPGGNVYVLNRGNGNNGTVMKFDPYGAPAAPGICAVALTNANGIALDSATNIYVTVESNKVKRIAAGTTNITTIATITNANTLLRGIAVTTSGHLAVCDSGRHGILLISLTTGAVTNLTGFNGAGDRFGSRAFAKFNQPYGIAADASGTLVVTDLGNHRVKTVDPLGNVCLLYGVCSNNWVVAPGNPAVFPGWYDGFGCPCDITCAICDNYAEAREPAGVVIAPGGDVYTTELYYHIIRKTIATRLSGPQPGGPPLFNGPMGIALDGSSFLFVADQTNNAIQMLYLANNQTTTVLGPSDFISRPVDVALDDDGNLYVLNQGTNGSGYILQFDPWGNTLWNAAGLVWPTAMMLDEYENLYVTERGGAVKLFNWAANNLTVVTITNAGVQLQGIAQFDDGTIAVSDAGNHVVWQVNPLTGTYSLLTGRVGVPGSTLGSTNVAQLNQPHRLTPAAGGRLVAADSGNNRIVVIHRSGAITNVLNSTNALLWFGRPGDPVGTNSTSWVSMVRPVGVALGANGTVFSSETLYQCIRGISATGLTPPPPPPPPTPVSAPAIGWVDFVEDILGNVRSVLRTNQPFSFNNDVTIAILAEPATTTYYTHGPTPTGVDIIPAPSAANGSTPPVYRDGLAPADVPPSLIDPLPDLTIKAISTQAGRPDSPIARARFQFITASPVIVGDNAALFRLENVTTNAQMWYTWDGTDPTNGPPSIGPVFSGAQISTNLPTGTLTFKVRAYKPNYAPSGIAQRIFSATNFQANRISFGFESGEASSDFVASPGQFFYAPVTLNVLQGVKIYSLQFNVTATNVNSAPPLVPAPGYVGFKSMLMEKLDPVGGVDRYREIPPGMFTPNVNPPPLDRILYLVGERGYVVDTTFTNTALNLLGVGWLERIGKTNLYNTEKQDLIAYSMAHDTVFLKAGGKVVVGGYAFRVPATATNGQQYRIAIDRPSATSDGIGAPGSDVFIETPTNGSLAGGAINAVKHVTVGQRKYVVGDVYPFGWFNAGDFGKASMGQTNSIVNADVVQVFQSASYGLNMPPAGSDFFDAMDSCCGTFTNWPGSTSIFVKAGDITDPAILNGLFDGNDLIIDSIAFGDGVLDVTDVYVTFRRSLDPSLAWFRRFWTNGIRVAEYADNNFRGTKSASSTVNLKSKTTWTETPAIAFSAGDVVASAGQTVPIPITARIRGSYPIRVLMLNLAVKPLDGSPALTSAVQFTPAAGLGQSTTTSSRGLDNYAAAWLNSGIAGLSGTNVVVGTLTFTVPAGAPANAAYAIHFDHASASPNGIAPFPKQTQTGLLTLSVRTNSSWGDGIPDSWRLRYFGTMHNVLSAAQADADGDGMTNWEEFQAGTDPNNRASALRALSQRQSEAVVIRWPSVAGKRYILEQSPTLLGGSWTAVATNLGTGAEMQHTEPASHPPTRFYRVRVQD